MNKPKKVAAVVVSSQITVVDFAVKPHGWSLAEPLFNLRFVKERIAKPEGGRKYPVELASGWLVPEGSYQTQLTLDVPVHGNNIHWVAAPLDPSDPYLAVGRRLKPGVGLVDPAWLDDAFDFTGWLGENERYRRFGFVKPNQWWRFNNKADGDIVTRMVESGALVYGKGIKTWEDMQRAKITLLGDKSHALAFLETEVESSIQEVSTNTNLLPLVVPAELEVELAEDRIETITSAYAAALNRGDERGVREFGSQLQRLTAGAPALREAFEGSVEPDHASLARVKALHRVKAVKPKKVVTAPPPEVGLVEPNSAGVSIRDTLDPATATKMAEREGKAPSDKPEEARKPRREKPAAKPLDKRKGAGKPNRNRSDVEDDLKPIKGRKVLRPETRDDDDGTEN